jgi:E3 ubiquitin-protein ligase EDD1
MPVKTSWEFYVNNTHTQYNQLYGIHSIHGLDCYIVVVAEVLDDLVNIYGDSEDSAAGELCPLFYQPGKSGFYSIRVGVHTPSRLNAYRNVGRVIGLALLHSEMMPISFCRHVYKYLLNRKLSWHDLAFFDPVLYEGLRKLVNTAQNDEESVQNMDLSWHVTLSEYEGGTSHCLLPASSEKLITAADVYEYVYLYAELRMIKIIEEPLQAMKSGLYDVLPTHALNNITAEDLRLLLCGCQQVELDLLKKITTFTDESRKGSDQITKFKSWFWSIVERMSNRERQDLLYFWTSSPAMPANPESYQPPPSITLRPTDDQHLPTSNTCISRLYLPLYSSKALLKAKLIAAIKIKTFGFI